MIENAAPAALSFAKVYQRFMSDPAQDWSPRTRLAYETTRRLAREDSPSLSSEIRVEGH